MARKAHQGAPKAPKTTPVRVTDEAIEWARIASGYTGESVSAYVSRVIAEYAARDAERLHAAKAARKGKGGPS